MSTLDMLEGCAVATFTPQTIPPFFLYVTLNRKPELKYERVGDWFWGRDGVFFDSLHRQPGSRDGFAGRTITLRLIDGSEFVSAPGEMWSSGQRFAAEHFGFRRFIGIGYCTPEHHGSWIALYMAVDPYEELFEAMGLDLSRAAFVSEPLRDQPRWCVNASAEQARAFGLEERKT